MPKRPRDEDDFEVVEDEHEQPRPKKKRRPTAETQDARAADTDEYPKRRRRRDDDADEDERPSRRKARAEDDDDRPSSGGWGGDEDDDDRPRRKKKKSRLTAADRKRMKREDDDARDAKREQAVVEWGGPIFLTFLGVLMTTVAGVVMARRTEGLISPPLLLGVTTAWTLVLIPIVIVSLMVIGGLAGIDYGTLKNAVRSLVAITFVVNGIYWVGNLFPFFGWFLAPMIAGVVTFALFMLFFNLDPQETSTSLGVLNVILWVANMAFKMFIIAMLSRGFGGKARDDDAPRFQPRQNQFDGNNNRGQPNQFDEDDGN